LQGEYGQQNITISVPAVLGKRDMKIIIELELNDTEHNLFNASVATTREELITLSKITNKT